MNARILVCDDEELIRWSLNEHLGGLGYSVDLAEDGLDALEKFQAHPTDLLITDLRMPKLGGIELLRKLRSKGCEAPIIILTAHGEVASAIEATRLGAAQYLTKPFDLEDVSRAVAKALKKHRVGKVTASLKTTSYGRLIGNSPPMLALFNTLRRLEAVAAPTVLLTGESGTGKDVVANTIHEMGQRRGGPMMQVDCASLPENLVESELFGHERGAFTDAKSQKRGIFEEAKEGTIFLDEIGEMSPVVQAKLLRALENRTFRRVGGTQSLHFNAGVIAATNRDLEQAVSEGSFREDLYFRLKVIQLRIPPLRERREDVHLLVNFFVERFNQMYRKSVSSVSGNAMALLGDYAWPGNVRELRNVIERIMILEASPIIDVEQLPPEIRFGGHRNRPHGSSAVVLPPEGLDLQEVERSLLSQAMERTNANQSAAARLLGITRYALRYRLNKFDLL